MPKMSKLEAITFEHESIPNMVEAESACPEETCEAYQDIFTYNRWQALGYQVRRGEKGTKLTVFIPIKNKADEIVGRRPKYSWVFCRHQVDPIKA